jgi:WD40 repeat protein
VDGRTIAVIAQGLNSVTFYDLGAENTAINTITPGFLIGNVTFSPDLRYIAVTQAESWEVVIYSFVSGQEVIRLTGYETAAPVFDAGFNFSPQWMVWHSRGTIQLQEVETGKMGARFEHQDFVSAFALSKDGSLLASVAGITLTVWDASQGTALKTFSLTNPANAVAFSPDGNLLATGSGKSIDIREVTSGKLLVSLGGHFDQITTISFSPDGKYIATTGFDNQLYLWQVSQ